MSQIHTPVIPTRRVRGLSPTPFLWWVDVLIFGILIAIAYGIVVAASRWIAPLTPPRRSISRRARCRSMRGFPRCAWRPPMCSRSPSAWSMRASPLPVDRPSG